MYYVSGALQVYLSQVMALQYSDQPDYRALRAGLSAALQKLGGSLEQPLDLQVRIPPHTQPPLYPQAPVEKTVR
jgi:hypothetical protein